MRARKAAETFCKQRVRDEHGQRHGHSSLSRSVLLALSWWGLFLSLLLASNVIALDCKGGKGRTVVFTVAGLIFSQFRPEASQALFHFAQLRTCKGKREQGVNGVRKGCMSNTSTRP